MAGHYRVRLDNRIGRISNRKRIAIGYHGNPHHKVLASLQHTNPQSKSLRITAPGPPLGVVVYIWLLVDLGQPRFFFIMQAFYQTLTCHSTRCAFQTQVEESVRELHLFEDTPTMEGDDVSRANGKESGAAKSLNNKLTLTFEEFQMVGGLSLSI